MLTKPPIWGFFYKLISLWWYILPPVFATHQLRFMASRGDHRYNLAWKVPFVSARELLAPHGWGQAGRQSGMPAPGSRSGLRRGCLSFLFPALCQRELLREHPRKQVAGAVPWASLPFMLLALTLAAVSGQRERSG